MIRENKCFIAGSALIHSLHLEHKWKPNDIDIWTTDIKKFTVQNKRKTSETYAHTGHGSISVYNIEDTIINVNEIYCFDTSKIFIKIGDNVKDKIINGFDYDFLKASFDGKELIIYKPENVFLKKSMCESSCFRIDSDTYTMANYERKMFERHRLRVEKYLKRGFTIIKCICSH